MEVIDSFVVTTVAVCSSITYWQYKYSSLIFIPPLNSPCKQTVPLGLTKPANRARHKRTKPKMRTFSMVTLILLKGFSCRRPFFCHPYLILPQAFQTHDSRNRSNINDFIHAFRVRRDCLKCAVLCYTFGHFWVLNTAHFRQSRLIRFAYH